MLFTIAFIWFLIVPAVGDVQLAGHNSQHKQSDNSKNNERHTCWDKRALLQFT